MTQAGVNPNRPSEFTYIGLTIQTSGSSLRVTVPKEVVEDAGVERGDVVEARYDREAGTMTYYLD